MDFVPSVLANLDVTVIVVFKLKHDSVCHVYILNVKHIGNISTLKFDKGVEMIICDKMIFFKLHS